MCGVVTVHRVAEHFEAVSRDQVRVQWLRETCDGGTVDAAREWRLNLVLEFYLCEKPPPKNRDPVLPTHLGAGTDILTRSRNYSQGHFCGQDHSPAWLSVVLRFGLGRGTRVWMRGIILQVLVPAITNATNSCSEIACSSSGNNNHPYPHTRRNFHYFRERH